MLHKNLQTLISQLLPLSTYETPSALDAKEATYLLKELSYWK